MASSVLLRGFVRISGDDAVTFLQGIVTQDMRALCADAWVYGAFLTPQGKYLVDFFAIAHEGGILLDVDAAHTADFIKRLSLYRLRSKVTIDDVSSAFHIVAHWGGAGPGFADPRWAGLGTRELKNGAAAAGGDDYVSWQMRNGVPAADDFLRERTPMLEANMDILNALSWDKGCYMGQELTARTHYRGLVKKRYLPLRFAHDVHFTAETAVKAGDKTVGHIRRCHKNYAIASMMLDSLGVDITVDGAAGVVVTPEWFIQP